MKTKEALKSNMKYLEYEIKEKKKYLKPIVQKSKSNKVYYICNNNKNT